MMLAGIENERFSPEPAKLADAVRAWTLGDFPNESCGMPVSALLGRGTGNVLGGQAKGGGESRLLGDVAHAAEEIGVPAVVVIERGKTYFANDRGSAQAYADMTLAANSAPTLTGTAQAPGVGRGIDLEDLVDIELDDDVPRPLEQLGTWVVQNVPDKRLSLARAFPFMRHPLAVALAKQTTIQNGAIGLVSVSYTHLKHIFSTFCLRKIRFVIMNRDIGLSRIFRY